MAHFRYGAPDFGVIRGYGVADVVLLGHEPIFQATAAAAYLMNAYCELTGSVCFLYGFATDAEHIVFGFDDDECIKWPVDDLAEAPEEWKYWGSVTKMTYKT